jgi:hypothetical protein
MSLLGVLGILLAFLAYPFAMVEKSRTRVVVFVLCWLVHVVASFIYYQYVQTNSADTALYYLDPYSMIKVPIRPGTLFAVHLVQGLKSVVGGTYLDYFFLFQALGFWGIALMMRVFEETHLELGLPQRGILYLILFMPGVHFWTSAVGKDAPLFFACALAVWAAMRLPARIIPLAVAIVVMTAFRPHVALVAVLALALTAFLDPRARGYLKFSLLAIAVTGAGILAGTVEATFSVDVSNAESVSDFFNRHAKIASADSGTTGVVGASFPVRLLSLLFRPLFIDAEGAFGLVASVENIFLMVVVGSFIFYARDTVRMARHVFYLRFALIFAAAVAVLLTLVYYNVGLGLRQKMMMMPGMLTFFVALQAVRSARRSAPVPAHA